MKLKMADLARDGVSGAERMRLAAAAWSEHKYGGAAAWSELAAAWSQHQFWKHELAIS